MRNLLILLVLALSLQWMTVSCDKLSPSDTYIMRVDDDCCIDDGKDYPDYPVDEDPDNDNGGDEDNGDNGNG